MLNQLEACYGACQAENGPAGSSLVAQSQPQGSDVLPGWECLLGLLVAGHTASIL